MNNNDERDYEEEKFNRALMENPEGYDAVTVDGETVYVAGHEACPNTDPHKKHVWPFQDEPYLCQGAHYDPGAGPFPQGYGGMALVPDPIDDGPRHWLTSDSEVSEFRRQHPRPGEPVEWEKDLIGPIPPPKPAWIFVFGFGHKLYAYLPEAHQDVQPQEGISLAGYYVKIHADDEEAARTEMIRRFGNNWSSTYSADSERGQHAMASYRELKGLQP